VITFDESGRDADNYQPFILADAREHTGDIVMLLPEQAYPDFAALGYPATGHGIRALVIAARQEAGLEGEPDGIGYEAEFDQCFVMFADIAEAEATAELTASAFRDPAALARLTAKALANQLY
jgi:hypothetical protein